MIKSGPIEQLPLTADLGVIMAGYGNLALQYGTCAARHNTLVDYLAEKP